MSKVEQLITKLTHGRCDYRGDEVILKCPFPECCDDTRLKFYYNQKKRIGHCFRCGHVVVGIRNLLLRLGADNNSIESIKEVLSSDSEDSYLRKVWGIKKTGAKILKAPDLPLNSFEIKSRINSVASGEVLSYLRYRGFSDDIIFSIIHPYYSYTHPDWVVLPVMMNEQIAFWARRAMAKGFEPKYMMASTKDNDPSSVYLNKKDIIWGYDWISSEIEVVICEGIFDAASVFQNGGIAIALLGKQMSTMQRRLLLRKKIKKAAILLDGDAAQDASKLYYKLRDFIPELRVITLPSREDPNSLIKTLKVYLYEQPKSLV